MNLSNIPIVNHKVSMPLISVAMSIYNGEAYLAEAIDSILAQSFTNFEFIIIDDGSTDNSLKILREYEKRDTRIRLIARENKNLATTLNEIIDLAFGKWIARMDQDDIALPERFERQLAWLDATGADIGGSWVQFFGTSDKRVLMHAQSDEAIQMELLFGSAFAHPSVMMKTELVKKLRYDKAWEKCEDYDLWERAARAGWKMTNIPEVLLHYRLHSNQISSNASLQQQSLTQKIRHRYGQFFFDKSHLNKQWIDEVLKLREPIPAVTNMDMVDDAFDRLLQITKGEARDVVFDHMTRLYFRAAPNYINIAFRWQKLSYQNGFGIYFLTIFKLVFLSIFKISPKSSFFQNLKKVNFQFSKRN